MYWLRVFGGLGLERDGAVVDDVVSHRKALALLAVLATQGPTSRDRLLALLWPESDTVHARGSLKQAVHFLRHRLASPDLLLGTDELRLNPAVIETDIGKFAEAFAEGDLRTAAAQYGGRFLDGYHAGDASEFERWTAARGDELAQRYADVLEKLARAAEAQSEFADAASWWRRLQALDPTNSRFTLNLMHALEATGQRAAALQHARIQELLLREQWGLEPDAEVAALAATLRAAPSVAAQIPAIARDELVMSSRPAIVVRKSPHGRLLRRPAAVASIIILLALGVLGAAALVAWLPGRDATDRPLTLQRLVVIPFDEPRDSVFHYLAFGLGDAIATELARFRALIVPSQRSTARYSGTTKPLSQIALELSAAAIVSGSVQRDGDRIRVEVKLFDAKTNQQLWAQRYEHPNTEALEIQRSATQAIVAALRVDLTKAERALLARAPTTNPRAYDLYLRARELELRFEESDDALSENIREAQSLFARARDLDPNFAMARSRLAWLHIFSALKYDPTMGRREQARIEAETALRIHPGLAEAHEALAAYWDVGRKDYEKSIAQLKLAQAGWPNNVDLRLGLANMHARWGRWEEAIAELKRAQQLEPHNSGPALYSAFIYGRLRRYEESIEASDRVIAQKPDDLMHKVYRGYSFLRWQGISDTLAATLRGIPATWDPNGMGTLARYMAARVERHHSEALAVLNASDHDVSFDMYTYRPLTLLRAQTYDALGDHVRARSNYEAARVLLVDSIAAHPEVDLDYSMATPVARMRIALGLAYAGLGRKQEAAVEARRAMELAPLSTNIQSATAAMAGAAEVFTQAGDTNTALRLLELLLGMPAGREISVPLLRKDPAYDPLRGDPRFERLLTRFSTN